MTLKMTCPQKTERALLHGCLDMVAWRKMKNWLEKKNTTWMEDMDIQTLVVSWRQPAKNVQQYPFVGPNLGYQLKGPIRIVLNTNDLLSAPWQVLNMRKCPQRGRQHGIKNKAAITLSCKSNVNLIATLLFIPYYSPCPIWGDCQTLQVRRRSGYEEHSNSVKAQNVLFTQIRSNSFPLTSRHSIIFM